MEGGLFHLSSSAGKGLKSQTGQKIQSNLDFKEYRNT